MADTQDPPADHTHAGSADYDAIVVGGGFYGCSLALLLRKHFDRVVVLERDNILLGRASYRNQARVHQGYHYPRAFLTGLRSAWNFWRFSRDFQDCIDDKFEHVYAIARVNSRTNAFQFRKFCKSIGAPLRTAPKAIRDWFNPALIEEVYTVREVAFNAEILGQRMLSQLQKAGVEIRFNTTVERFSQAADDRLLVHIADGTTLSARRVLNCAYSGINTLLRQSGLPLLPLKHEVTEIALVEPPEELRGFGVTVMDGPFFSTMPFPPRGLHSLSHVRYTPHTWWRDSDCERNGYVFMDEMDIRSNYEYMLRDAQRYLPVMAKCRQVDSLYEIKTVLIENEGDDGRPILMRRDHGLPELTTLMGGKIDNIYDVLKAFREMSDLSRQCVGEASERA